MTNDKRPPCFDRLDAECFEKEPAWAKQAFTYRLMRLLLPDPITKLLPMSLREALVAPGVTIPPGVILPPGAVFPPGSVIPPGWTPADALPLGVQPPPVFPVAAMATGVAPPSYVAPATSEPATQPGKAAPPAPHGTPTIAGSTSDGTVSAYDTTWATARDAPTNAVAWDNVDSETTAMAARFYNTRYYIRRSFFIFDLSTIPAGVTILTATVGIIGYYYAATDVSIQEGEQHDPLVAGDWNAFTGTYFAKVTWQKRALPVLNTNLFVLNEAGIQHVQDSIGGSVKFCTREYEHDYLNVAPDDNTTKNGCRYADDTDTTMQPYITITY